MKEYWVNVYQWGCSALYEDKQNAINWNKISYRNKEVLYRIHVKMKESKYVTGREILARQKVYKINPRDWEKDLTL